ncbi:MAG TPA: DUF2254 domain-containing protein [Acidimicrobiia bacterium]|nr:DUF2254 domain-containing protein [Acidimicrobiia bacterium]
MSKGKASTVSSSLWFIPVVCVLAGVVLSIGTMAIDRAFDFGVIPRWLTGGPDAALGILTTIAVSMVSLAALVLTITMVVVQLAMGQFSPRIVQTFLRDRPSQLAIGLFVATFAHAILAMREIQFEDGGQVPGIAVVVAYVLVLISIAMLVLYVNHIGRSLRVSALIELVGRDTRSLLDKLYPDERGDVDNDPRVIVATKSGVVNAIDRDGLIELAIEADCVLHVVPPVGGFVPAGAPLMRIVGGTTPVDHRVARSKLTWGLERTLDEDVAYGFRMLVDMAERGLSESPFLDPTTAVQALDRLHDGLRQLVRREFPDGRYYDEVGRLRLVVPVMDWDAYVHLAFDEVRLAGAGSPQVTRRLAAALQDLRAIASADRQAVLDEQLELLYKAVEGLDREQRDLDWALVPDGLGFGVAADEWDGFHPEPVLEEQGRIR